MEQAIRDRFNDAILQEAQRRYGIKPEDSKNLGGFESYIYEFARSDSDGDGDSDSDYIRRIAHSKRRTPALIQGEVDWINYLADGGAGVARAVSSDDGNLVEMIDDGHGGHFLATAFVKAPGGNAWQMEQWDERLWVEYGRLLGRIHRLSKDYVLPHLDWKRPEWDDPVNFNGNWLPADQPIAKKRLDDTVRTIAAMPKDRDSFGLIHQDAHGGNFFVDEEYNITLFDFDDCVYGHFVYDIAMVLFYAVTNHPNPVEFGSEFMPHFLRGYREENVLDPKWMLEIPHFLKHREIDLYGVIYRSFDMEKLEDDTWVANFMRGRREKIEANTPYLVMDYGHLQNLL